MQIARQFKDNWSTLIPGILISIGLLLRDAYGYEINKYIFLTLAAWPIVCAGTGKVLPFISFLIPLYFGLPGNYISVLILGRLFIECTKKSQYINQDGIIISIILSCYIFFNTLFRDHEDPYSLMGSLDYIILFLFASLVINHNEERNVNYGYAWGTAILGALMLTTTLQHFALAELMGGTGTARLGQRVLLQDEFDSKMLTSIDPNFYGMYVIALLSSAYLILSNRKYHVNRTILLFLTIASIVICLFGISRTFLIVLFAWGIMTAISRRSFKGLFAILSIFAVFVTLVTWFFPEMVDAFNERMTDSTMEGGNGRVELIEEFFAEWEKSAENTWFGLGLQENNVHCGPLRYLFGIGLLGFGLITAWFFKLFNVVKQRAAHVGYTRYVPFFLTFIVFSTLPAAGSLNAIYPLILSILAIRL